MKGRIIALSGLALAAASCGEERKPQRQAQAPQPVQSAAPKTGATEPGVTPMAQRVAVIGLLNKRNGIVRDLTMRPGQAMRVRDAVVRLRACETSAPWELEKLTGAFVQLEVERTDGQWQRVFSGWLYKEAPSLNVVEHPVYDVWPKSCTMTFPSAPAEATAPVASSNRSSARNSGAAPAPSRRATPAPAEPAPSTPEPSAADSNDT